MLLTESVLDTPAEHGPGLATRGVLPGRRKGKRVTTPDGVRVFGKAPNREGSVYRQADGRWCATWWVPGEKRPRRTTGKKNDRRYRSRRLLTKADERLDDRGRTKVLGLFDAGDPRGEVGTAWHAKEVVRTIYDHHDPDFGLEFLSHLGADL